MSLINEALKKAQKQRADEAAARSGSVPPPGMGAVPPAPPRPPQAPAAGGGADHGSFPRPDPLIAARTRHGRNGPGRFALPAVVLVALALGGFWWLRPGGESTTPTERVAPSVAVVEAEPMQAPAPARPVVTIEPEAATTSAPAVSLEVPAMVARVVAEPSREPEPLPKPSPAPAVVFTPPSISDSESGIAAADEDEADMVERLATIDRIDRAACRSAAEQRFSADRMVDDHVDLYRKLVDDARHDALAITV